MDSRICVAYAPGKGFKAARLEGKGVGEWGSGDRRCKWEKEVMLCGWEGSIPCMAHVMHGACHVQDMSCDRVARTGYIL